MIQYKNIHLWYPELEFWILETKVTQHRQQTTREQIIEAFGESRFTRIANGFDPQFFAYKMENTEILDD